jgi:hypothetical protein
VNRKADKIKRDAHKERVARAIAKRDFLAANIDAYEPLVDKEHAEGIHDGPNRKYMDEMRKELSVINGRIKAFGPTYLRVQI